MPHCWLSKEMADKGLAPNKLEKPCKVWDCTRVCNFVFVCLFHHHHHHRNRHNQHHHHQHQQHNYHHHQYHFHHLTITIINNNIIIMNNMKNNTIITNTNTVIIIIIIIIIISKSIFLLRLSPVLYRFFRWKASSINFLYLSKRPGFFFAKLRFIDKTFDLFEEF